MGRHLAELKIQVDQQHARRRQSDIPGPWSAGGRRSSARQQDGGVHREGGRPDSALRAEEGNDLRVAGVRWRVRLDLARANELRHHAALELAVGEAADDHVVRPGLEEGDLGLHVVGRRDDEDRRDPIGAGGAQRGNGSGSGEALGNDEVELASAHGGHGIGRRADRGGRVSDVGES